MFERTVTTELKVGIFTVGALAAVGTLVLTLEGNPFGNRAQKFNTVLQNVGGVGPRTQVRTSGVQVGEVESIDILPKGAKVNFRVNGTIKIPKGSYIELRSRGILGDVYLEIVRNEDSKDDLPSGSQIPQMKEFNDMGTLMSSLGSIAQDLQTVSNANLGRDTQHHFGPAEWAMTSAVALTWGASFLFIAIAIDHVATGVVPVARLGFGALALACFPPHAGASRVRTFSASLCSAWWP